MSMQGCVKIHQLQPLKTEAMPSLGHLSQRVAFIPSSCDTIQAATGSSKLHSGQAHCHAQNLWLWGVSSITVTEQKSQG